MRAARRAMILPDGRWLIGVCAALPVLIAGLLPVRPRRAGAVRAMTGEAGAEVSDVRV